jgi:acyl carrier protein
MMPSEAEISDRIFEIVARQAKVDISKISPASTFKDLAISSLTAIEVIFEIEERFDITFPDQDANLGTDTLQHLIEITTAVLSRKAGQASAG